MIKKDKGYYFFRNLELIKQTSPNADKRIKEIIGDIIKRLDDNLTSVSKNRYNDELISKINALLEIELKCNKKHDLKESYSFFEVYDKDYIAGMTEGRVDLDSEGFRRESFHLLVSYFTDCYMNRPDEFQTYL